MGVEVHVLTVDPAKASYIQRDESLTQDIHPAIQVHYTNSFEPLNLYSKIVGKDKVPTSGFSNVDNDKWSQKLITFIRSNVFIPDPRRGWNRYAYARAKSLVKEYDIQHVVTTSPPHSTQLIGLKLKQYFGQKIHWVADFRDPWTDIYYYKLLRHTAISHWIDKRYERQVIEQSDAILTVANGLKPFFLSKSKEAISDKLHIITNGFDADDFKDLPLPSSDVYTISYVGSMGDSYRPQVFFDALAEFIQKQPQVSIQFRWIGEVSPNLKVYIQEKLGEKAHFIPRVTHVEAVEYMSTSHMLLLVAVTDEGVLTGKLFEYLAVQRNIVCIGAGDPADLVRASESGQSFSREEFSEILDFIHTSYQRFAAGEEFKPNAEVVNQYTRKHLAKRVVEVLRSL